MGVNPAFKTGASHLAPRDLASLSELKSRGLSLLEVKISEISAARGQLLSAIVLPERAGVVCVIKAGQALLQNLDNTVLETGDSVYLLAEDETEVRAVFTV